MPLQKQAIQIPFAVSLDTKTDPLQLQQNRLLTLVNAVFTQDKSLIKRNGFAQLGTLATTCKILANFQGNLTAIGQTVYSYSTESSQWISKGAYQPLSLSVLPLTRNSYSQSAPDVAVAPNGVLCTVYVDGTGTSSYELCSSTTGQVYGGPTALPSAATNARVYVLGNYFIITFIRVITAVNHLQFIAVPYNNVGSPTAAADITTTLASATAAYDAVVTNNSLYVCWNASDGGGAIRATTLSTALAVSTPVVFAGLVANLISITADTTQSPISIWITFYRTSSTNVAAMPLSLSLAYLSGLVAPVTIDTGNTLVALTASAQNQLLTAYYEVSNTYSFSSVRSDYLRKSSCTQAGVAGTASVLVRSLGLGSKSFIVAGSLYVLGTYAGTYQPTYFVINASGQAVGRVAYANGAGYASTQVLSNVAVTGNVAQMAYLIKDLITPVNKTQGSTTIAGVYTQTGVNFLSLDFDATPMTAEIGSNLNISGGFLWSYDGNVVAEQNFNVWPEDTKAVVSGAGGLMTAQQYYYQFTYEWTDAQGNIHRSAPSIPLSALTAAATSSVTLSIPTLRLTYKSLVRICIYRWSTAQQSYYQVTSISSPTLNSTSTDAVTYVDTLADSAILGNQLIYTTGGVVEDICPPATSLLGLYKSRLFLVESEDPNTLWYSKQAITGVPVEMSDLFTYYTAPTTGAQGSTGPTTSLGAMDDKLVIFKADASYYITGNGPDNTGANNDFSEPNFITGIAGCSQPNSVVFVPNGLLFQSDKGIWQLGRDLSISYKGAPVEDFNSYVVNGALSIPLTNQVRFTLSNTAQGLVYDYFSDSWGSFSNMPAISSVLNQGLHTYLSSYGQVFQETPGVYLDGSIPVVMSLTTSWFNLNGLQGYERAHFFYLLGTYISPHKLQVNVAYDYNPSPEQSVLITPDNYAAAYGTGDIYGTGQAYGGPGSIEQWRIFFSKQKCQAFQLTIQEVYDSSLGASAGAGLTLSGLNLVVAAKKGYSPISTARSAG